MSTAETMRRFVVIRPYDQAFRRQVFGFLASMGFDATDVPVFDISRPDGEVANWTRELSFQPDLWLIPFHRHRGSEGSLVDGFGALSVMNDHALLGSAPILMPVAAFSYASSFPRRLEVFSQDHPSIVERLVVMPSTQLGSEPIRQALSALL